MRPNSRAASPGALRAPDGALPRADLGALSGAQRAAHGPPGVRDGALPGGADLGAIPGALSGAPDSADLGALSGADLGAVPRPTGVHDGTDLGAVLQPVLPLPSPSPPLIDWLPIFVYFFCFICCFFLFLSTFLFTHHIMPRSVHL